MFEFHVIVTLLHEGRCPTLVQRCIEAGYGIRAWDDKNGLVTKSPTFLSCIMCFCLTLKTSKNASEVSDTLYKLLQKDEKILFHSLVVNNGGNVYARLGNIKLPKETPLITMMSDGSIQ